MEGFKEFEDRRKMKFDKQINSNVMITSKGLNDRVKCKLPYSTLMFFASSTDDSFQQLFWLTAVFIFPV